MWTWGISNKYFMFAARTWVGPATPWHGSSWRMCTSCAVRWPSGRRTRRRVTWWPWGSTWWGDVASCSSAPWTLLLIRSAQIPFLRYSKTSYKKAVSLSLSLWSESYNGSCLKCLAAFSQNSLSTRHQWPVCLHSGSSSTMLINLLSDARLSVVTWHGGRRPPVFAFNSHLSECFLSSVWKMLSRSGWNQYLELRNRTSCPSNPSLTQTFKRSLQVSVPVCVLTVCVAAEGREVLSKLLQCGHQSWKTVVD